MTRQSLIDSIKKFPKTPGVYFFKRVKNNKTNILYIGKATSLRDRVRSYFSNDIAITRGPKIVGMLEECTEITFEKTDSVLEALLLEAHLIKKYQPEYNTKEKDNKSFYYVVITKEDFPRVLLVRGRDILVGALGGKKKIDYTIAHSFGPFPSGQTLRDALGLIRKIFPFRDKCVPCVGEKCKPTDRALSWCVYGRNINRRIQYDDQTCHTFFQRREKSNCKRFGKTNESACESTKV